MIAFYYILFWPFIILYSLSKNKKRIEMDLISNGFNGSPHRIIVRAAANRYFRSLLYFRERNIFSKVLRVFYPKERYFIIDIHSDIAGGIKLAHPYSTIINAESIGTGLYINHLVTIGEKQGKRPVIGNNVELHANCSIIGGITIGDNVIVGAGAVVVKDVPENSLVVGNPMRIIRN